MSLSLKPLAITMGDPSGIGPEIIVSSFEKKSSNFNAIVLGCPNTMKRAVKINHSKLLINTIKNINDATFKSGVIDVLEIINFKKLPDLGKINAANVVCRF